MERVKSGSFVRPQKPGGDGGGPKGSTSRKSKSAKKTTWRKIRKPLFIALFVLLNVVVIAATAASEFGNSKDAAKLAEVKINWWLLLPAAGCFALAIMIDIYKYIILIRRTVGKGKLTHREEWRLARRTVILGKYYDNITPAAVGGQPFQIYYMRKSGLVPAGLATTIPIIAMIAGQLGFLILALVCFLFRGVTEGGVAITIAAAVGLAVYAFWPAMVFLSMFFPKAMARLINAVVKLLAKLKIVKDAKKASTRIEYEVREYAQSVRQILKSSGLFPVIVLLMVVFHVLMASIPYFVLTAFGGDVGYWESLSVTVAVMAAVYFVPTPGNSGAAEGTFFAVFSALSTGYVFWAMLVWRLFSYYLYIIMGAITFAVMQVEKRRAKIPAEISAKRAKM